MNKGLKSTIIAILFIVGLVLLAGIYKFNFTNDDIFIKTGSGEVIKYNNLDENNINKVCNSSTVEKCPSECVVCPPCPACSSLRCNSEEFCTDIGFDKSWYDGIKENME